MKGYYKGIITILTLLWMGVIFYFSAQPAVQSAGMSGGIIDKLKLAMGDIPVMSQILESGFAEHILRKGAHAAEYAVLGVLLLLCMREYLPGGTVRLESTAVQGVRRHQAVAAFVTGVLYAASDEYHQTFVPGRSGEIRDVCIDSMGVVFGILIAVGGLYWKNFLKKADRK